MKRLAKKVFILLLLFLPFFLYSSTKNNRVFLKILDKIKYFTTEGRTIDFNFFAKYLNKIDTESIKSENLYKWFIRYIKNSQNDKLVISDEQYFYILWTCEEYKLIKELYLDKRFDINDIHNVFKSGGVTDSKNIQYDLEVENEKIINFSEEFSKDRIFIKQLLTDNTDTGIKNLDKIKNSVFEGYKEEWNEFLKTVLSYTNNDENFIYSSYFYSKVSDESLRDFIKDKKVTIELIDTLARLNSQGKINNIDIIINSFLYRFIDYQTPDNRLLFNLKTDITNKDAEININLFSDGIKRLLISRSNINKFILIFKAVLSENEMNINYSFFWNFYYSLDNSDSFYAFLNENIEKYKNEKIIFDTNVSNKNLISSKPLIFLKYSNLFKYILYHLSNELFTNRKDINIAIVEKFKKESWFKPDEIGFSKEGEKQITVSMQMLKYYKNYYRITNLFQFNKDLWSIFTSPEEVRTEWLTFMGSIDLESKYNEFKSDKIKNDVINYFIKNVFVFKSGDRGFSPDGIEEKIFIKLYFNKYLNDREERSFFLQLLTKIKDAGENSKFFYDAFTDYAVTLMENAQNYDDYIVRFRLYHLMIFFSDEKIDFMPKLFKAIADEYKILNPEIFLGTDDNKLLKPKIVEVFFNEEIKITTKLVYKGEEAVIEEELRKIIELASYKIKEKENEEVKSKIFGILKSEYLPIADVKISLTYVFLILTYLIENFTLKDIADNLNKEILESIIRTLEIIGSKGIINYLLSIKENLQGDQSSDHTDLKKDYDYVLKGINNFFYNDMTLEAVKALIFISNKIADKHTTELSVTAVVKIIFYSDQKENDIIADYFIKSYLEYIDNHFENPDSIYPELINQVTSVYFFRNRRKADSLKNYFNLLLTKYYKIVGKEELEINYLTSMLIISQSEDLKSFIVSKIYNDKNFFDRIIRYYLNIKNPQALRFLYNVYGPEGFLKVLKNEEVIKNILADFDSSYRIIKIIFENNLYYYMIKKTSKSFKARKEIDHVIRDLVFTKYFDDTKKDNELKEKLFMFFLNDIEVAKGEFDNVNMIYFPKYSVYEFSSGYNLTQEEIYTLEYKKIINEKEYDWFSFYSSAVEFFIKQNNIVSKRNFTAALVYIDAAVYYSVKKMIIDFKNKDTYWAKLQEKIYYPIFKGDYFTIDDEINFNKVLSLKYINFDSSSSASLTGFDLLLNQLVKGWIFIPGKYKVLQDYLKEFIVGYLTNRGLQERAYTNFYYDFAMIFYYKIYDDFGQLRGIASGKKYYYQQQLFPDYKTFVYDPTKPLYLDSRIRKNRVISGNLINLYNTMINWYSYSDNNSKYFDLMPSLQVEGDSQTKGDNKNVFDVKWGFYSDTINIVSKKSDATGDEAVPDETGDAAVLEDIHQGFTKIQKLNNKVFFMDGTTDDIGYRKVQENYIENVKYRMYFTDDSEKTNEDNFSMIDLKGYMNNHFFVSEDMKFNALIKDTQFVIVNEKNNVNPDNLVIFSKGIWTPASFKNFTFDGFKKYSNIFLINKKIEKIGNIQLFNDKKSIKVKRYPLKLISKKHKTYIASVDKKYNTLNLVKSGMDFYIVIKNEAVRTISSFATYKVYPIKIIQDGDNIILFKCSSLIEKPGDFNFTVFAVHKDKFINDSFCLVKDEKNSIEYFKIFKKSETIFKYKDKMPDWTTKMVILKKIIDREEIEGRIKKDAVVTETGRFTEGHIFIMPKYFTRLQESRKYPNLLKVNKDENVFYYYPKSAFSEDNTDEEKLFHFVTIPKNNYFFNPDYGTAYYRYFYDAGFGIMKEHQKLKIINLKKKWSEIRID